MSVDIATYVHDLAVAAKAASASLATASDEQRQEAVRAMAAALRNGIDSIVAANELDMSAARDAGTSAGLLDRLLLRPERVEGMAAGLEKLAELPDPVGRVLDHRVLASGVDLTRVSVPLGLVAMVYEARPNVTADAAGICIRTGNACILRGGSLAYHSCAMISELLADALEAKGFPREAVSMIESTDREATGELMKLRGIVDVLIPRGGAGLIQRCVRESLVPVIETGTGNCHIYVHESADFDKALNIIVNAKTQRVGVCNAAESLLVDHAVANVFLPAVVAVLHDHDVLIHGDEATCAACVAAGLADVCTVSLAYAIGQTEPVAVEIDTQESGYYDDAFLIEAVRRVFDFTPAGMIRALDLDKPFFAEVCNNCHFMHPQAAWEQTDKAEKLRMSCAELEDEHT